MGDSGKSQTIVTNTPSSAPSVLPEAREGYNLAQSFFKNVLQQPPVYGGPRLAPVTPAQGASIDQSNAFFGAPQPFQTAAENQVASTARGDYLGGPAAQGAVASLAAPIFSQFNQEVLPGIRDRAQFSGQGITSSRRAVAESNAIRDLGNSLGTSVVAPIFTSERGRQIDAAGMAPQLVATEAARIGQLRGGGEYERGLGQQELDVIRGAFEEPLFRQSEAANALGGMAGFAPGGSINESTSRNIPSTSDQALSAANTALMAAAVASKLYGGTR